MRRRVLIGGAATILLAPTFGFAQRELQRTPLQTLGPFYPPTPPEEDDHDLTRVKAASGPAKGELTSVSGVVFDTQGRARRDVRVEIWQCDANGRYHHPMDTGAAARDPNFQGFGATRTSAAGEYSFRTIKPVPYPGRTPHIHFKLEGGGVATFVTQMYIAGHPGNASDGLLVSVRDKRARDSLLAPFVPDGRGGWTVRWDIVVQAA